MGALAKVHVDRVRLHRIIPVLGESISVLIDEHENLLQVCQGLLRRRLEVCVVG